MKNLHRHDPETSCWQTYKELELIPNSVPNPHANKLSFRFGFDLAWRLLIVALTQELVDEQQVEYLERCWTEKRFEPHDSKSSNTLQRLWTLMN